MDPALVEVVHVGSACRDVAPDDARGWRLGGGVAYAALTTARLGIPTAAIVGVDASASDALELDRLAEAGVAILRIPLAEGPIFDNRETPTGRVQTCVAAGVRLPIPEIPAAWLPAHGWSLVPVAGELDDAWAAVVPASASLAVAWQGFLRELVPGREVVRQVPETSAVLGRADLVGVSRDDVAAGTSEDTLWRPLHPGAALLLTDGSAGGAWIQVGPDGPVEVTRYGAIPPTVHVDPTGAGDVVLAALHAVMLKPSITGVADPDRQAMLRFAAAAGSLVVEGRGLDGVPWLDDVLRRAARA
jgi:sugar/nucleoside kinase (ribokinase family)